MPFPFQAMGLGQFGRGGMPPWQQQQPDPNLHGPWEGPPITGGGFDRAAYDQRYQRGLIPGSPGYEASVQQNPGIDPQTGQPWQAITENWGGTKPQGIPGGYGGAPQPPMGQGQLPPMGQGQMPPMGQSVPWQSPHGQPDYGYLQGYGGKQPPTGTPMGVRPYGYGQMPLGQFGRGQGGGWGSAFGGALGGFGGLFGMRR